MASPEGDVAWSDVRLCPTRGPSRSPDTSRNEPREPKRGDHAEDRQWRQAEWPGRLIQTGGATLRRDVLHGWAGSPGELVVAFVELVVTVIRDARAVAGDVAGEGSIVDPPESIDGLRRMTSSHRSSPSS